MKEERKEKKPSLHQMIFKNSKLFCERISKAIAENNTRIFFDHNQ